MRLCFPQYFESRARFLTYTVVAKALMDAGHELVPTDDGCDAVLFSICDVTEFRRLARCRRDQLDYWLSMAVDPNKKLTVDGAYSALMDTGVLDTPMLKVNHKTGQISVIEGA